MERVNALLLSLFVAGSLIWWDPKVTLGVALGGGLMVVNLRVMRKIFERAFVHGRRKGAVVGYALKFLALVGAVVGVLFCLRNWVDPLAFLGGTLTLFLAALVVGLRAVAYPNRG